MKERMFFIALICCLTIFAQTGLAEVSLKNYHTTFRVQSQRDTSHWGWTPKASFKLNGPISNTALVSVEFTLPDGKTWFTADCEIQNRESKTPLTEDCGEKIESSKTSWATGLFGYKIKVSDELNGTGQTLMTGRIKVGKFLYNPSGNAEFNQQFYYYLDNDWRLPIGFVYQFFDDGEPVALSVDMWFKGEAAEENNFSGHLFYQGKEIGSTNQPGGTVSTYLIERAIERNPFEYYQRAFKIPVEFGDGAEDSYFKKHNLKKNPGDYELKVMFRGKLVRSVKFSIGSDGLPVDNGIAKSNQFGNPLVIIPVAVLGTLDGSWNTTAWQTEAFWGNPLKGFTAQ